MDTFYVRTADHYVALSKELETATVHEMRQALRECDCLYYQGRHCGTCEMVAGSLWDKEIY